MLDTIIELEVQKTCKSLLNEIVDYCDTEDEIIEVITHMVKRAKYFFSFDIPKLTQSSNMLEEINNAE